MVLGKKAFRETEGLFFREKSRNLAQPQYFRTHKKKRDNKENIALCQ
jgi:hypothetical protein